MSAIGAMAGAAAGAACRCRQLEKIDQTFSSTKMRQDALTIFDLILESEGGNAGLAVAVWILGSMPAMLGGMALGGMFGGELGTVIGIFAGLIVSSVAVFCANYYLCKRPARKQLQKFVETHPEGKLIEQKVREIISCS